MNKILIKTLGIKRRLWRKENLWLLEVVLDFTVESTVVTCKLSHAENIGTTSGVDRGQLQAVFYSLHTQSSQTRSLGCSWTFQAQLSESDHRSDESSAAIRFASIEWNIRFSEIMLNQGSRSGTHCTVRKIARETGIPKSTVHDIVSSDPQLKHLITMTTHNVAANKKITQVMCAKQLPLKSSQSTLDFMSFANTKVHVFMVLRHYLVNAFVLNVQYH